MTAPPIINPKSRVALDRLPERLRPDQVADYLNCSRDLVLDLIHSGELAAVDVAGATGTRACYRITRDALIAFEQSRTV